MKSKLGKAELVMAYELKAQGVKTKHVANMFGVKPTTVRARILRCEKFGLGWLQ